MKTANYDALIQAVLDGEASPGEAAELERLLAADPTARARFGEWRALFDGLARVPHGFPPEGLVAAVMAGLPRHLPAGDDDSQLFPPPGVIAASSKESRVTSRGTPTTVHAISQTGPFTRGAQMSERTFSKRKVWIGIAVAVAAIAVGSQFVDYPPKGQDAAGTIAPAQRYRAQQMTSDDVKVGGGSAQVGQPGSAGAAVGAGVAGREALDAQGNRQALDAQGNRQALDAQGNRQALDAQGNRQALDAQGNRQALDAQGNRQALDAQNNRNALDAQSNRNARDAVAK